MTEEAQRIAIAKACGWVKIYKSSPLGCAGQLVGLPPNAMPTFENECVIPDYINDLNAIWLAVRKGLTGAEQLRTYEAHLHNLSPDYPTEATAAQRAEAYLRTIGKWKGGSDES